MFESLLKYKDLFMPWVNAFLKFIEGTELHKMMSLVPELNEKYRNTKTTEVVNADGFSNISCI